MEYTHLPLVFARAAKPLLAAVIAISAVSAAHSSVLIDFFQDQHGLGGDGDEAKLFVDKTVGPVSSSFGSLVQNDNSLQNIAVSSNVGSSYTTGSGFATFKSSDHGSPTNPLTAFTFSPGTSNFDGAFIRGQIDSENGSIPVVTETVNFIDTKNPSMPVPGMATKSFSVQDTRDIGRIGFDENADSDPYFVTSVMFSLASGAGWNQVKQVEFSVPGVVSTPVPEAPGLVMVLFAICGAVSLYGMQRIRSSAPNAP
jgi:hypothetical protein